ncbi:MAG: hypothetical protein GF418_14655 [Chitinivibrionales bacterium]|nr:hypothetical protein [Chitinivibrionales bacterium]MBD3396860.1 hypothetical protein [Chitinivibrionales bacterium]
MYRSVVCIGCAVLIGAAGIHAAHEGVPQLDIPYADGGSKPVEEWWAAHPFYPESPNYDPAINSPSNEVSVSAGESIQDAVEGLPVETGGTIRLGAGTYRQNVVVQGTPGNPRRHVHILGEDGAVLEGCLTINPSPKADDYDSYDGCLHRDDADCWATLLNPAQDVYVKNVVFDGYMTLKEVIRLHTVRDVIFDSCTFRNVVASVDYPNNAMAMINGICQLTNLWFRGCTFQGSENRTLDVTPYNATYLDGLHGGGMIGCTTTNEYWSNTYLFLTNLDFTEDENGNGQIDYREERECKYVVIYDNEINSGGSAVVAYTGQQLLFAGNAVLAGKNHIMQIEPRVADWITYQTYHHVIVDNTISNVHLSCLYYKGYESTEAPFGRGVVRCNTFEGYSSSLDPWPVLIQESGYVEGPHVIEGNCVEDPGCVPADCELVSGAVTRSPGKRRPAEPHAAARARAGTVRQHLYTLRGERVDYNRAARSPSGVFVTPNGKHVLMEPEKMRAECGTIK